MAQVRLLVIPPGADRDAEGVQPGHNWDLLDLGEAGDGSRVWLTTDHAHASDLCDDDVLSDPLALGRWIVEALNNRPRKVYAPRPTPEPVPYVAPDPTARDCGTCRHWAAVQDMDPAAPEDCTGVCQNSAAPWDTPKRRETHDAWAAAMNAGEEHPCHEFPEANR